jgi:phospholipid N-methyltransferase
MRQQWADYRVFWREFRQAYHTTGAVLPSGRALARALARYVGDGEHVSDNAGDGNVARTSVRATNGLKSVLLGQRILEVGPGTGAVTGAIICSMQAGDTLTLVERNEQFVARLRERLDREPAFEAARGRITLLQASVEDVAEDVPFDLIISGLPLNNFSVELVERILAKLRRLLAPGGTLSFFEYVAVRRAKALVSPRQRERLRGIQRVFDQLLGAHEARRDLVLANVPPAWVHHVRFGDSR